MANWKRQLSKRRRKLALTQLFEKEEHAAFVQAFADFVEPRGVAVSVEGDEATLQRGGDPPITLDISALAARCQQSAREGWPALVREHLERRLRPGQVSTPSDPRDLAAPPAAHPDGTSEGFDPLVFERCRARLKVRLVSPDTVATLEAEGAGPLVRQDPADGLVAVLFFDLPGEPRPVRLEDTEAWATPLAAAFAVAYQNLGEVALPGPSSRALPGGERILACRSESPFLAAQIVIPDRFVTARAESDPGENPGAGSGILASVPKEDLLLLHPIREAGVEAVVEQIARLAQRLHDQVPASLSPHVYWWRNEVLTRLPVTLGADGARFDPPPASGPTSSRDFERETTRCYQIVCTCG
jgi:hypothetical protein